jgi:hypothetical protein
MISPVAGLFSASFEQARARFCAAASAAGAWLHVYQHPRLRDTAGLPLGTDVAVLGDVDATRALVIVSGTHGVEGFFGSAAQLVMLRELAGALPPGLRLVLVHAINPWGFAERSRTTEHGVDLNRNFIEWREPPPANAPYRELHALLRADTPEPRAEDVQGLQAWIERHGQAAYFDAVSRGQYEFPDGAMYGGSRPEWSNQTLRRIVADHLRGVERAGVIDWHTGLGAFATPAFLCFDPAGSPAWRAAADWWGESAVAGDGAFGGAARPRYAGLLYDGLRRWLAPAQVAGAVIEFGTRPYEEMLDAMRLDRVLRSGSALPDAVRARMGAQVFEAFCPADDAWRRAVASRALEVQRQAMEGVARWKD